MKPRKILDNVHWLGAVDWDRRLFDALVPLPDGTSYNAYLIEGDEKTALIDTVDPSKTHILMAQLENVEKIDYVISLHAEQDHSGSIPAVLDKYPHAQVITSKKAEGMLVDLLQIPQDRFNTPWVHWPETMVAYLQEDKILFSCDFFGSHIASSDLYVKDQGRVCEAAKRYFAEIMLPFRSIIAKNLEKLAAYDITLIAPSHGQIYDQPGFIMDAYRDWVTGEAKNLVVLPYVSMHNSTKLMVDYLVNALMDRNVGVEQYELPVADIGKLAISLVDAATIVIGTPTVLAGPHPAAAYAAFLANALRPKAKFLSIIGSYSWGGRSVEILAGMVPNLKVEVLEPVLAKGVPNKDVLQRIEDLADAIAAKHKALALKDR